MPAIAVVIVTYNSADGLPATLEALAGQLRPEDELVVVDNASTDGSAEVARASTPRAHVVEAGGNVGFAHGSNLGAAQTTAPLLFLLNPDCVPAPGCLDALRAAADARPGWGAWQALVTLEDHARVNTAGNPVHFLGFAWAGGLDEPVSAVGTDLREAGTASGAALAVRRAAWDAAGGFDARYFMYGEDVDLSLRLRLAGWEIGVAPAARVHHDYTFTKGDYKWFYLERNRWWTVLGTYPGRLLAATLPALLAFELVMLLAAWHGGWLRAKLRAQRAVLGDLRAILARRRAVQATRTAPPAAFADALVAHLDSPNLAAAQAIPGAAALTARYWRIVRAIAR